MHGYRYSGWLVNKMEILTKYQLYLYCSTYTFIWILGNNLIIYFGETFKSFRGPKPVPPVALMPRCCFNRIIFMVVRLRVFCFVLIRSGYTWSLKGFFLFKGIHYIVFRHSRQTHESLTGILYYLRFIDGESVISHKS